MTHRVVHDARTTLLVAVSLDTFARNASANADMKDASCVRQGEIATCCNRLGISNAWVLRRIHNYAEAQFVRPRTPAVRDKYLALATRQCSPDRVHCHSAFNCIAVLPPLPATVSSPCCPHVAVCCASLPGVCCCESLSTRLPRESPTKHWPLFKIWKTLSVATGSHAQFFQKRGREPR